MHRPSRRSTVDWFTPSRRAISASRTPAARHSRARSHAASPVSRGRPAGRTSAAVPSRSARWCSVATYAALSPSTAATSLPGNFSCRSTAAATCRIAASDSAYSASTADPTITRHRPAARSRCRSQGSGMSSSIARVTARMPAHPTTDLTNMQHSGHKEPQVTWHPPHRLREIWGQPPAES